MAKRTQARGLSLTSSSKLVLAVVVLVVAAAQVLSVGGRYVPSDAEQEAQRRQDSARSEDDDDELDGDASAPYQQDDSGRPQQDGYDDNESDGPYGETPRDEEGQADLERFFDDHLGASERDGMDKENLPSQLSAVLAPAPDQTAEGSARRTIIRVNGPKYDGRREEFGAPTIETRFVGTPGEHDEGREDRDGKLIVARQIISSDSSDGNNGQSHRFYIIPAKGDAGRSRDDIEADGSEVRALEDDDLDRVYVMNGANKPFKIPTLGNYDPEEDFRHASREFEEPKPTSRRRRYMHNGRAGGGGVQTRDITFSDDPEAADLYEDASETDEVTFGQEDPYQTDLEAEMRRQQYDQPGKTSAASDARPTSDGQYPDSAGGQSDEGDVESADESRRRPEEPDDGPAARRRSAQDPDDDEGGWVNDGVDDMEIPSQSHQDSVVRRAAEQEALRAANEELEAREADEAGRRMPNADYLREALVPDDSDYRS